MSVDQALPEHVHATFLRADVGRLLRAALEPGRVALVLAPGVLPPELPKGRSWCSWSSAEAVRVASVPLIWAVEVASARAARAAEQLGADPPARCAWCLYLDAGLRCAVVPFPVLPPSTGNAPPSEAS